MAKVGSRRTGGAGIDVSNLTGFLRFVAGQDPATIDYATQAQAQAGTNNTALVTPLRVAEYVANALSAGFSSRLDESSAPTEADNAAVNGDDGRALSIGSLWRHVKVDPPTSEEDVDWYRLDGFKSDNAGNGSPKAIWAKAEQVDASVLATFASADDLADVQTDVATLLSQMAIERARVFESTPLVTVGSGEVIIELPSVPNDDSVSVMGQSSAAQGLFPFLEDEDFTILGSWLFFRNSSGTRSVDNGDKLNVDWFTDLSRPGAVTDADADVTNITWTDSGTGGTLDVYKCLAASDPMVAANWADASLSPDEADESVAHGLASGDRVIVRLNNGTKYGVWSDILTV